MPVGATLVVMLLLLVVVVVLVLLPLVLLHCLRGIIPHAHVGAPRTRPCVLK